MFVQTGYLVPAGDEDAFADRVSKLMDDKALRMSMSKAGREETEKWSWEAATSVLRNVQYAKVGHFFSFFLVAHPRLSVVNNTINKWVFSILVLRVCCVCFLCFIVLASGFAKSHSVSTEKPIPFH